MVSVLSRGAIHVADRSRRMRHAGCRSQGCQRDPISTWLHAFRPALLDCASMSLYAPARASASPCAREGSPTIRPSSRSITTNSTAYREPFRSTTGSFARGSSPRRASWPRRKPWITRAASSGPVKPKEAAKRRMTGSSSTSLRRHHSSMDSPSWPRRSKMRLTSSRRITSQAKGGWDQRRRRASSDPRCRRNRNDHRPRRPRPWSDALAKALYIAVCSASYRNINIPRKGPNRTQKCSFSMTRPPDLGPTDIFRPRWRRHPGEIRLS